MTGTNEPPPPLSSYFRDDATAEMCATDPRAEAVCRRLLRIEAEAQNAGWDGPLSHPRLFEIDHYPDRP